MKRLLATITVVATLAATSASAFDPAHLKRLMETNECKGCELSNANLMGAKLRGAILVEAILARADELCPKVGDGEIRRRFEVA